MFSEPHDLHRRYAFRSRAETRIRVYPGVESGHAASGRRDIYRSSNHVLSLERLLGKQPNRLQDEIDGFFQICLCFF
jgi:hypothetical protein